MKLLFDENLSPKLPNRLSDIFPDSLHVRDVGMKATSCSIDTLILASRVGTVPDIIFWEQ
jgi:predicted nuclease of predicted toxin-antitoxin system